MRAPEIIAWLASLPARERDAAIEEHLGIASPLPSSVPPGEHLIGYHASGVAAIVRAIVEVPVAADDVVVDLGAGLGKVVLLAHLLTGARARGIELQPALVARARAAASHLGVDVAFELGDARTADVDDGTVFFLYAPFTGPVLSRVVERLRAVADRHAIVVCALAVELNRDARWLVPRPIDSFWLSIYDSVVAGTPSRSLRQPPSLGADADAVAER
jgi:SAM-dependent methyltransferase